MLSQIATISIVVALSLAVSGAEAQDEPAMDADALEDPGAPEDADAPEDAEAQAQRYFMEARVAFEEQRYADARRLLDDSLSLAPRPATAINLARVLRSLGEQLEIITTLTALIAGRYGEVADERLVEARELLAEARRALSHIVVRASSEAAVAIRVDGVQVNQLRGADAHEQEVDPGEHVIVGVTDDGRIDEVSVDLGPGERREVALTFPARAVAVTTREPDESSGTSPWVWVAVAGGALAVGAVVLAIVLATSGGGSSTAGAVEDPRGVFPVIEALSW